MVRNQNKLMVLLLYSCVFLYALLKLSVNQIVCKDKIFIKMHIMWFLQTTFQYASLSTTLITLSIQITYNTAKCLLHQCTFAKLNYFA